MLWIFSTEKIRQLWSGANPRSWVPEASMQTPRPPKPLHEDSKVVSCVHWLPLLPRRYPWYSFLLAVESASQKIDRLWVDVRKYSRNVQVTDDNIIWCRRDGRMQTHIIFNTYRFSMVTVIMRTRLHVTLCVHCMSCLTTLLWFK
jgi:hypothetical protein